MFKYLPPYIAQECFLQKLRICIIYSHIIYLSRKIIFFLRCNKALEKENLAKPNFLNPPLTDLYKNIPVVHKQPPGLGSLHDKSTLSFRGFLLGCSCTL